MTLPSQKTTRNQHWRKQTKWYDNDLYPSLFMTAVCTVFVVLAFVEFVKECV